MNCGVGHSCGWDLGLLWLWPAAVALIRALAWEPPYAVGAAIKRKKKKKDDRSKLGKIVTFLCNSMFLYSKEIGLCE